MSDGNAESPTEASYNRPDALPYQQENVLKELYLEQDLTQTEISEKFSVDQSTIHHHLSKHGLLENNTRGEMDV